MTSLELKSILNKLDELSDGKLKFRDDIEKLVDTAIADNKMKLLEEISFTAKFIQGLLSIIQKKDDNIDPAYFEKAVGEYTEAVSGIKNQLEELISANSEFYKSIFSEKFFSMTQVSLQNLNNLCADLSYLKLFFNDQKYSKNKF